MNKKYVVAYEYQQKTMPIGTTVLSILFYHYLDPKDAWKGVLIVLFILVMLLRWGIWISSLFLYKPGEPEWK